MGDFENLVYKLLSDNINLFLLSNTSLFKSTMGDIKEPVYIFSLSSHALYKLCDKPINCTQTMTYINYQLLIISPLRGI
jgi:hypothetical protein